MAKLFTAGKWFGQCVGKQFVYGDMTSSVAVFTITGGPITIYNLGIEVTTLTAGTNTLKFQHIATGGSLIDLCGATDTDAAAVGQLFVVNGTKATALVKTTDVGILAAGQTLTSSMPIIVSIGSIYAIWSASSTAGAGVFFMEYSPLSQFTNVSIA